MDRSKSACLYSYALDGEGGGKEIDINLPQQDVLQWLHFDAGNENTRAAFKPLNLDSIVVEALLAQETRPRFEQIDDSALIMLRGVNLQENGKPEDMISIRLYVSSDLIVSTRLRKLKTIQDLRDKLAANKGPKTSGEFICMLNQRLLDRMAPVLTELDEKIDDLEEMVADNPDAALRSDIVSLRKRAIILRRYMAPQRDVVNHLKNSDLSWITGLHRRNLQESYDRITRYVEDLDAIRERTQIVQDELMSVLSERMNKNMYVLSLVAAIFLPLGFLTGLLGINVGGIPGADNPQAFLMFCGILAVFAFFQIMIFKAVKWL